MFEPHPQLRLQAIPGHAPCVVVDGALRDPQALVALAVRQRASFTEAVPNSFPGLELRMPADFCALLNDFFLMHVRAHFGVRRLLSSFSRLSMVTRAPEQLTPLQRVPHRDYLTLDPGQRMFACVLYLFHDATLGGTGFYRPRCSEAQINALRDRWSTLSSAQFTRELGAEPAYPLASNAFFERVAEVPAAWNRLIFYDSTVFHSGDIVHPQRMRSDAIAGRLTLNGFFVCRPVAS